MKRFTETIGEIAHRNPHPPLRTTKELATEFGIPIQQLVRAIHSHAGPEPVLRNPGSAHAFWYNPVEVRKWWKKLQEGKQ
jgi:hypothetical protein